MKKLVSFSILVCATAIFCLTSYGSNTNEIKKEINYRVPAVMYKGEKIPYVALPEMNIQADKKQEPKKGIKARNPLMPTH